MQADFLHRQGGAGGGRDGFGGAGDVAAEFGGERRGAWAAERQRDVHGAGQGGGLAQRGGGQGGFGDDQRGAGVQAGGQRVGGRGLLGREAGGRHARGVP